MEPPWQRSHYHQACDLRRNRPSKKLKLVFFQDLLMIKFDYPKNFYAHNLLPLQQFSSSLFIDEAAMMARLPLLRSFTLRHIAIIY